MEIFDLKKIKTRRAVVFYSQHREILNDKKKAESTMYLGGLIDMERIRKATRVDTASGYRYCQNKFMSFCARYFGTTVTNIKNEFNKSLTNS